MSLYQLAENDFNKSRGYNVDLSFKHKTTKVYIIDLKLARESGTLSCCAQDVDTGERIISGDLVFITKLAEARGWQIVDAQETLRKIAMHFNFYSKV